MKSHIVLGIVIVSLLTASHARAQSTFVPTSGDHFWNVNSNWSPPGYPDASGATATLSAPTGDLTIDLGEEITVGTLTVNKSTSGSFDTTITGTTTNKLIFDGGTPSTLFNESSSTNGAGVTTVAAPIEFASTFAVNQRDDGILQFTQPLSGAGGLTVTRDSSGGSGVVALGAENTYSGPNTFFDGFTGDSALVVRLNHAAALPGTTNVTLKDSAILELGAGNFTRAIGTGAGEIQFETAARSGWSAFGGDWGVNIGNDLREITWGTAGFGQLVLGAASADSTVDFQNPLVLDGSRNIRSYDGSAAIDGKISGQLRGSGGFNKQSDGVLSLAAANIHTGDTKVQGGVLRLDHSDALPSGSKMIIQGGGILGIGVDTTAADASSDFARVLRAGAAAGELEFLTQGGNNGGFSAHGGDRTIRLLDPNNPQNDAQILWGTGGFVAGGLDLSQDSADSMVELKNPIDLNGLIRTIRTRNGTAAIDGKLSGVISGSGGLTKQMPGTLELSAANTYDGTTTILSGVLLLTNAESIPGGITGGNTAHIVIDGSIGAIGLGHGNFTSGLGTGTGQIQFITSGGFAAYGADRIVNLGGQATPSQVTWGAGNFVSGSLLFSALDSADAAVDFQNPINLGSTQRLVVTRNGLAAIDGILSGEVSGAVGGILQKLGFGTLVLTGDNTYVGGTLMDEGSLLVNNTTGSGTGSGPVMVSAGTLGGTGTIAGAVTVNSGGHLAPGASAGILTVGSATFESGSFFDVELGGTGFEPIQFDRLAVNGAATINGGTLNVSLIDGSGYTPAAGDTFHILTSSGLTVNTPFTLDTTNAPAPANTEWQVTYNMAFNAVELALVSVAAPIFAGDYNDDGFVDAADYVVWRHAGPSDTLPNDETPGTVDTSDHDVWVQNFGEVEGGAGGGSGDLLSAVPEPSTVILAALLVSLTLIARPARRAAMAGRAGRQ